MVFCNVLYGCIILFLFGALLWSAAELNVGSRVDRSSGWFGKAIATRRCERLQRGCGFFPWPCEGQTVPQWTMLFRWPNIMVYYICIHICMYIFFCYWHRVSFDAATAKLLYKGLGESASVIFTDHVTEVRHLHCQTAGDKLLADHQSWVRGVCTLRSQKCWTETAA